MELAVGILAAIGGTGTLVLAVGWLIRRVIDHRLGTKLEAYKGELGREAERLRHDLQREMLKAQLETDRMYDVGPKLLVKVKKAHGALSSVMGLSFAPDWNDYDRDDLERAFDDRRVFPGRILSRRRKELLAGWDSESPGASRQAREDVRRMFFEQQVGQARALAQRAHNYVVLSSVLLPPDLAKFAAETTAELVRVSVQAELQLVQHIRQSDPLEPHKRLEAAGPRISELEQRIRTVLAPAAAAAGEPSPEAPHAVAAGDERARRRASSS